MSEQLGLQIVVSGLDEMFRERIHSLPRFKAASVFDHLRPHDPTDLVVFIVYIDAREDLAVRYWRGTSGELRKPVEQQALVKQLIDEVLTSTMYTGEKSKP